jgi:hypothetical protein
LAVWLRDARSTLNSIDGAVPLTFLNGVPRHSQAVSRRQFFSRLFGIRQSTKLLLATVLFPLLYPLSSTRYTTNKQIETTTMSATTKTPTKGESKEVPPTFKEIMNKAAKSAARGGTAGAIAMGANVACLMWMRTTVRT